MSEETTEDIAIREGDTVEEKTRKSNNVKAKQTSLRKEEQFEACPKEM